MKKYRLTEESMNFNGRTLFRIEALCNFGDIKKGELGGWIECEENLSHSGDAWVYGDARVYDNAWVLGNARVLGDAKVFGNAWVFGKSAEV